MMDRKSMRNAGLGAGALCLAAAVGVAVTNRTPEPLPQRPTPAVAPAPSEAGVRAAPSPPAVVPIPPPPGATAAPESAAEPPTPPPGQRISFIVRFEGNHPMARAQSLEAEGRHAEAAQAAQAVMQQRRALRGLCFDRFTAGGYETILSTCDPVAAGEHDAFARRWTTVLSGMDGVEYAEPNVVAQPEGA